MAISIETQSILMFVAENQLEYEEWLHEFNHLFTNSKTLNQPKSASTSPSTNQSTVDNLLLAILDAAVVSDALGVILSVNDAMTTLFGYPREELIGSNVKMLMPSNLAKVHDEYLQRYIKRRDKRLIGKSRNVLGKHNNGVTFPVEISLGEMANLSATQGVPAYIAVFRNKLDLSVPSESGEEEEVTNKKMQKAWSMAAFDQASMNQSRRSDLADSSSSEDFSDHEGEDETYLEYDHDEEIYHGHQWLMPAHNSLSNTSSETNTATTESGSSSPSAEDLFGDHFSGNVLDENYQAVTKIRLNNNKKRLKQRLDQLNDDLRRVNESEYQELKMKFCVLKNKLATIEEENDTLQRQMDNLHETMRLKELETNILDYSNFDNLIWKETVRSNETYKILKKIAKEEQQYQMLRFLRRSILYQDSFTTLASNEEKERARLEQKIHTEAVSIVEEFFGRAPSDDEDTPTASPTGIIHSQSCQLLSPSQKLSSFPKQTSIFLSSRCDDLTRVHLSFPTPNMFDMAANEVIERLNRRTFLVYTERLKLKENDLSATIK